jgi:hypothetical protein
MYLGDRDWQPEFSDIQSCPSPATETVSKLKLVGNAQVGRISEATAYCGGWPWDSCPLGNRTLPGRRRNAWAIPKHPEQSLVAATPR